MSRHLRACLTAFAFTVTATATSSGPARAAEQPVAERPVAATLRFMEVVDLAGEGDKAAGDLNGDGSADFIVRHSQRGTTEKLAWWENQRRRR